MYSSKCKICGADVMWLLNREGCMVPLEWKDQPEGAFVVIGWTAIFLQNETALTRERWAGPKYDTHLKECKAPKAS